MTTRRDVRVQLLEALASELGMKFDGSRYVGGGPILNDAAPRGTYQIDHILDGSGPVRYVGQAAKYWGEKEVSLPELRASVSLAGEFAIRSAHARLVTDKDDHHAA